MREALHTLVVPSVCEQLLSRSLAHHGLTEIPEGGPAVGAWLEQSLKPLVLATVGPDAAELLLRELAPMAAYAASLTPPLEHATKQPISVLPKRRERDEITQRIYTLPAPPPPSLLSQSAADDTARISIMGPRHAAAQKSDPRCEAGTRPHNFAQLRQQLDALPRVLVASRDPERHTALQQVLAGSANVSRVADLVSLLDTFDDGGSARPVIVIDCNYPTIHVASIAAMRDELPSGVAILVWGADDATWSSLQLDDERQRRWVRCTLEATPEDVGSLCSMLLG